MSLHHKITSARKKKGITQEQLADMTNITVRTIQRIESGESNPRPYTLQSIAQALELPFDELRQAEQTNLQPAALPASPAVPVDQTAAKDFLQVICLSCFTYLVIPFVHFLIPVYILKKSGQRDGVTLATARRIIRKQLYWVCALHLLMLLTLAHNIIQGKYFGAAWVVSYLLPFFVMYIINAVIIVSDIIRVRKHVASSPGQESKAPLVAIVG